MAPVRNVDDASIYLIQRGACGRVCHILHTGFHLPPTLCYLRNMTFFRSSLFIFKLKLSYRLQTLLSTIDFISNKNIFTAPISQPPSCTAAKSHDWQVLHTFADAAHRSHYFTFKAVYFPFSTLSISELWKSGIIQYHRTSKS